ncbi:MAG: glycerophosphodiester phosphodiesterase [Cyanobacteria bacterium P01_G01_bin.19]
MAYKSTQTRHLPFFKTFQKDPTLPLIFGHRGVPEEHQENTMAGFKRAIALGLDGVELDVFLTKDNKLVVFHDLETERLTDVPGIITEMTWEEIQQLTIKPVINVGDKIIDYGRAEKIELLENVLEETRSKLLVNIEIKAYGLDFDQRHTGAAVAKLVRRMGLESDVFVTSFNFWPLIWLEKTHPGIESGFTYAPKVIKNSALQWLMESSLVGKMVGSTLTNMSLNMFDGDTIEQVHQRGLAVGAWTVFSQDSKWLGDTISPEQELNYIHSLTARGIDYFITDDPVRLRQVLNS